MLDSKIWQTVPISRGTTLEAVPSPKPIHFKYYHFGSGYPTIINLISVNYFLIKEVLHKLYDKSDLTHTGLGQIISV